MVLLLSRGLIWPTGIYNVRVYIRMKWRSTLSANRAHDVLVGEDVPWVAVEDDLAAVDRVEPVGHPGGVDQIRLGNEDRDTHRLDGPNRLDKPGNHDRREPLERLVQQQDRRPQGHGPGDGDHLLLSSGEMEAPARHEALDLREDREDPVVEVPARRRA